MASSLKGLPDTLVKVYAKYKTDTNHVAEWLASTAKKAGYSLDSNKQSTGGEGMTRNDASTEQKYLIAAPDFMKLARFIRNRNISVPLTFKKTLQRAIALRIRFSAGMRRYTSEEDQSSDANHERFVESKYFHQTPSIYSPVLTFTSTSPSKRP